jgi:hypothetical protein
MKHVSILLFVLVTVFASCKKQGVQQSTPICLDKKIESFSASSNCNDANVKAYTFQTKTVYVFDHGTCGADMTSEVIDSDCKTLGTLGGFTGNTKINGEEFSNAVFVKTVWQK